MPLPILFENLDRRVTTGHLGGLPKERAEQTWVKNLRTSLDEINMAEALYIKGQIEEDFSANLAWLKGGTLVIDGGSALRDVLKMADPVIGAKKEQGKRFNPKDKAQVNAYYGAMFARIQDAGINLYLSCHAANSWKMLGVKTDDGEIKQQLTRTENLYPKFDEIAFERSTHSLLFFKRCECGRNISEQDGTCKAQNAATSEASQREKNENHQGRQHLIRIVTNKFCTSVEGTNWMGEELDWATLQKLQFGKPAVREALLEGTV